MTKKSKDPCLSCDCWDYDAGGCTMPHFDKWYACPIESALPENQRMLEEMAAEWAENNYYEHLEEVAGRFVNGIDVFINTERDNT